jgi:fructosamine-3-kinase
VFLKSRTGAPAGEFAREAAGLAWLAEAGGISVPRPVAVIDPPASGPATSASPAGAPAGRIAPRALALEWVEPGGPLGDAGWDAFGRGLALTHRAGADRPGGGPPGVPEAGISFATATMPSAPSDAHDFAAVYAGRIEALSRQALHRSAIDPAGAEVLLRVADRVERHAGPPESVARLHGDLWQGNVMVGVDGRVWLIDPAAHGGHRELDLAMLELFGSPPARFFDAYEEVWPLAPGRDERIALWQIQPLLVHAILFGGGYGRSAVNAARAYAD